MERLTTNKDVSEMGMYELAHNGCYIRDGVARYRDFETDIDARELTRQLLDDYADGDDAFVDDDDFDEEMLELLMYGTSTIEGLIALFYRNMWAMADLRERLKEYENLEEQGRLIRLPCKVGDTVYFLGSKCDKCEEDDCYGCLYKFNGEKRDDRFVYDMVVKQFRIRNNSAYIVDNDTVWSSSEISLNIDQFGKTVFLTQAEAEQRLKEMESD